MLLEAESAYNQSSPGTKDCRIIKDSKMLGFITALENALKDTTSSKSINRYAKRREGDVSSFELRFEPRSAL